MGICAKCKRKTEGTYSLCYACMEKSSLPNTEEAKLNSVSLKVDTSPKIKGKPFNFLTTILLVVIILSGLILFLSKKSENPLLTSDYILGSPNQPSISTTLSQNQPSDIIPQNDNSFDWEKTSSIFPVLKNKKMYYLKGGNIWVADLATPENKAELFLDADEEILSFDISNDQDTLAYSVRRNPSATDDFADRNGDTILIRNLNNSSEFVLYSDKDATDIQIRSILFSPDGQHILIKNGCYEGSSQIIFDVTTRKADSTFDNGYISGGIQVFGFITSNLLLAVNNEEEEELTNNPQRLEVYDLSGNLVKQVLETSASPLYFDNKSEVGKIFISIPSGPSPMKNQSIFELNPKTFILSDLPAKKDIAIVLHHGFYDHNNFISWHNIWISNTILENPILIDLIDSPDKYDNLKLKLK